MFSDRMADWPSLIVRFFLHLGRFLEAIQDRFPMSHSRAFVDMSLATIAHLYDDFIRPQLPECIFRCNIYNTSESDLRSCVATKPAVKKAQKKFEWDSNSWPPRYQCDSLPSERYEASLEAGQVRVYSLYTMHFRWVFNSTRDKSS